VVRRYIAALQETSIAQGQEFLAEFRLTRKVAQSLGEFGDMVAGSGLTAALAAWGLNDFAHLPPEEAILGLPHAWLEEKGSLEAAVVRTALATCLTQILAPNPTPVSHMDGPSLVRTFLAIALCQRLALDLGESLEAAVTGWSEYQKGLARLQAELLAATTKVPDNHPGTGQWQGLAGWLWVTRVLENALQRFQEPGLYHDRHSSDL
jgi:hypothetical protein